MTVGETLAQARGAAGLSVDEVSGRTGIRETVIRSIEHDDFAALGGDLYVRGYLRAIAAAVELDPQPLIREFDATRSLAGARPAIVTPGLAEPVIEATPAEDYSSVWWGDDAVSDADPLPATQTVPDIVPFEESAPLDPPADAEAPWSYAPQPGHRARPGRVARPAGSATRAARHPARKKRAGTGRRSRVRGWRWATAISVFAVVVLGIVGVATGQIVARLHSTGHASAAVAPAVRPTAAKGSPAPSSPAATTPAAATPTATKSAAVTPTPKATPKPPPAVRLAVQEASAFGPDGVADGDNPQGARYAIVPGSAQPWQTDWYTTATFGQLKKGTGLLLDMGRTVTVTSVQIRLGAILGADLQVRAGGAASLGTSPALASAQDAGGALTLRLKAPARARYVIIWFTELPPSGPGKYQAAVYSVAVTGRP